LEIHLLWTTSPRVGVRRCAHNGACDCDCDLLLRRCGIGVCAQPQGGCEGEKVPLGRRWWLAPLCCQSVGRSVGRSVSHLLLDGLPLFPTRACILKNGDCTNLLLAARLGD
jgi:hypothetical protein